MRVETRVTKLSNLFREEFDSIGRVAEDDGLVDLKLGEKSVKAVDLLLLLHECVVLRDSSKGEFVHQVDLVWVTHVFVLRLLSEGGLRIEGTLEITLKDLTIMGKVALKSMT